MPLSSSTEMSFNSLPFPVAPVGHAISNYCLPKMKSIILTVEVCLQLDSSSCYTYAVKFGSLKNHLRNKRAPERVSKAQFPFLYHHGLCKYAEIQKNIT